MKKTKAKSHLTSIPCEVRWVEKLENGTLRRVWLPGELRVNHPQSSYGVPITIVVSDLLTVDLLLGKIAMNGVPFKPDWKYVRRELNLTQKQLAARLGVAVRTVQSWEAGRHTPPLYALSPLFRSA